ncbi:MAG: secondary thiamine-phosphate synthase enzyme YjbQ [Sedimentisphaeraceae bacterium JB056]
MKIFDQVFRLSTKHRSEMIDITSQVQQFVRECGIKAGRVNVFCPHTTAAITINENADPDVQHDILMTLDEIFPQNRRGYRHCEHNSDSHIKSSLVGASETVLVKDTTLVLGTWQGIYFCEFDGARTRKFMVTVEGN